MDQQEQANPLGMSDEAIMEMDFTTPTPQPEEAAADEPQETGTEAATEQEEAVAHDDDEVDGDDVTTADAEGLDPDDQDADETDTDDDADGDEEDNGEVDYKAAYEQIMAPFKANGKTIQVQTAADAIQLMQQGANYNKKMAALKPGLKVLKTLENNGLLDETKINYLIDLDKKNPEAIAKLVKDSGIDPLDMGTDEQAAYQPNSYTVDDKEMALDEVLSEIHDSPHYQETMNIIGDKWDAESRRLIVENPSIIAAINGQIETGVYAQIAQEMDRERMLGRLNGIPDVMAYRQIGLRMEEAGAFRSQPAAAITPAPIPAKKQEDPKLQQRRKAAGVTKTKAAKTALVDFNPLTLSDAEFEKQFSSQYM